MKKAIIILTGMLVTSVQAQIAIGKASVSNVSVSLEFGNLEKRGLILPYVENKSGITAEGTLIYDVTDHKVKYLKDNGVWQNLSGDDGTASTIGVANLSIQGMDKTENSNARTVIGANGGASSTNGLLVLSDTNRAMVLPKVASPHLNIISPAPGMMVYDTTARQLAIYNGKSWSFWKP